MSRIIESPELNASYIVEGLHVYDAPEDLVLMNDPRAACYERPMGFYSEELRQRFIDASARIAGVGGGGLTLAVMLAKEGVRDFSIADIDKVDETNVGRIPMLTPFDVGREKVDVAADLITRHNPSATVRVYGNGVRAQNVDEFLGYDAGNAGITVGFDEIDITAPEIALIFHRTARKYGRFVISATDVERGGIVTTFDPDDVRHTYEHYMGSGPDKSQEEFLKKVHGFQLPTIPNIPKNANWGTFSSVMKDAPLPTTLRSVLNATDLALDEFEKLLTLGSGESDNPHFFPRIHAVNPSVGDDFVTRFPRLRSAKRLTQAFLVHKLGRSMQANYREDDRKARDLYRQHIADAAGGNNP